MTAPTVPRVPLPPHTVRLRQDRFTAALTAAGYPSASALAVRYGLPRSTVTRLLNGQRAPGPVVIGTALHALGAKFDDLFEVIPR